MEDDYELVSKRTVTQLKEENSKLKSQLSNMPNPTQTQADNGQLIEQIVDAFHLESQRERDLILENLNEIKDLNKSTLDNLLTKTEQLDERLEGMVDTIAGLVEHLSSLLDSMSGFKEGFDTKGINDKLSKLEQTHSKSTEAPVLENTELVTKLNEISIFMENLRILLSYVKPSDMVMDKPEMIPKQPQSFEIPK